MARPISETPILYGEDAIRFSERMKNPPRYSSEKIASLKRWYYQFCKENTINM